MHQLNSQPRQKATPTPWEDWKLNDAFLLSLTKYTKEHPKGKLDCILEVVSKGLEDGKDLLELIPDSPFPARGLFKALSCLIVLGITIARTKRAVREFAEQVVNWVEEVRSAFENAGNDHGFNWMTWRSLRKTRALINEICLWARSRLADGRWAQIKHGLMVGKEIDDFKTRLVEAKMLFRDLSLIHLAGGLSAIQATLKSIFLRQDAILEEIRRVKQQQRAQLEYIINEMEEKKQADLRTAFFAEYLDHRVVQNPTFYGQGKRPCDEGTRIAELEGITKWLHTISSGSQNFLWLTGDPGCGKSAITASLAEHCLNQPQKVLLVQFFINRNNRETTDPNSYFPTIARNLGKKCPEVELAIYDKIKEKPGLAVRITSAQATNLFVDALAVAAKVDDDRVVAVIIDGLDETDIVHLRDTATIFSEIFERLTVYPNVKVFISSRTEDEIRNPFALTLKDANVKHIHLDTSTSFRDVAIYLRRRLAKMVKDYDLNWEVWPSEERMGKLVDRAAGLFIWAVTAAQFLEQEINKHGAECLHEVLDKLTGPALKDINALYAFILIKTYDDATDWDMETFRRIVGAIVVSRKPICLDDLGDLLNLRRVPSNPRVDIRNFIRRLRTVLVSGTDVINGMTIPRLHKSFFEFITDINLFKKLFLDHRFCVDPVVAETQVALCCLRRFADASTDEGTALSFGSLQYAFRFWSSHLDAISGGAQFMGLVLRDRGVNDLKTFFSAVKQRNMVAAGDKSFPESLSPLTIAHPMTSSSHSKRMGIPTERVGCLAFSPNGKILASGSTTGWLVLWDSQTAEEIDKFKGHDYSVSTVEFSQDGERIASGSSDNKICIWDSVTRNLLTVFRGHLGTVSSVTFSPDGQVLASGSFDGTVRLWNMPSGNTDGSQVFRLHKWVHDIIFTPDGKQIVSGTRDGLIHVWNIAEGECQQKLSSFITAVHSVAISPLGDCIVAIGAGGACFWSRSSNGFVLDDRLSFEIPFAGDDIPISRVAFSPDGNSVVLWYASTDGESSQSAFHVYNLNSRIIIPLPSSSFINAFALSPDGAQVAFGGGDDICVRALPRFLACTDPSLNGEDAVCPLSDRILWLAEPGELPAVVRQFRDKVDNLGPISFYSNNLTSRAVHEEFASLLKPLTHAVLHFGNSKIPISVNFSPSQPDTHDVNAWENVERDHCHHPIPADISVGSPLWHDVSKSHPHEIAGAQWFPVKKGFGIWAYIDGCLLRGNPDGIISVLPLHTTENMRNF